MLERKGLNFQVYLVIPKRTRDKEYRLVGTIAELLQDAKMATIWGKGDRVKFSGIGEIKPKIIREVAKDVNKEMRKGPEWWDTEGGYSDNNVVKFAQAISKGTAKVVSNGSFKGGWGMMAMVLFNEEPGEGE